MTVTNPHHFKDIIEVVMIIAVVDRREHGLGLEVQQGRNAEERLQYDVSYFRQLTRQTLFSLCILHVQSKLNLLLLSFVMVHHRLHCEHHFP